MTISLGTSFYTFFYFTSTRHILTPSAFQAKVFTLVVAIDMFMRWLKVQPQTFKTIKFIILAKLHLGLLVPTYALVKQSGTALEHWNVRQTSMRVRGRYGVLRWLRLIDPGLLLFLRTSFPVFFFKKICNKLKLFS